MTQRRNGPGGSVPLVDYAETAETIRAIESKFPGLAEAGGAESPFGDHFLLLDSRGGDETDGPREQAP
jgi:hypothetical protein